MMLFIREIIKGQTWETDSYSHCSVVILDPISHWGKKSDIDSNGLTNFFTILA